MPITIPDDPGLPDNWRQSAPAGIMRVDMRYNIAFHGEQALHISDFKITPESVSRQIADARQSSRAEIYCDKKLTPSDRAVVDVTACGKLFISAMSGKAALIALATHILRTGSYLLLPDAPIAIVKTEGGLRRDSGAPLTTVDLKVNWDYAVDQMLPEDNGAPGNQLAGIRTELKHRLWSLISPVLDNPVVLSEKVTKIDRSTCRLSSGTVVDLGGLNAEIRQVMRNQKDGESVTFTQTFDPDYVVSHRSVLTSMGPMAKTLDTSTPDGRAQFEEAARRYMTFSDGEFNNYQLQRPTLAQQVATDTRDEGRIYMNNEVDANTGEVRTKYTIVITTFDARRMNWITGPQLSANVKFSAPTTGKPQI